jgi:hypothetical protein
MAQVTTLQTKQLIISIGLSLTIGVIICDGLDFNSNRTTKRRILAVLKIVPIHVLVMAGNAKIMEDFMELSQSYVKCPRAVSILMVLVGTVLLMEEEQNASMPVAQNLLKVDKVGTVMNTEEQNASILVAQNLLKLVGTVVNMEEEDASMPVAQNLLKVVGTVVNMEEEQNASILDAQNLL